MTDSDRTPDAARPPLWARVMGALLAPWIAMRKDPAEPEQLLPDARPVCYVLERYGVSNALILDRACRESGLPSPLQPLPGEPLGTRRAFVAMSRPRRCSRCPASRWARAAPSWRCRAGAACARGGHAAAHIPRAWRS